MSTPADAVSPSFPLENSDVPPPTESVDQPDVQPDAPATAEDSLTQSAGSGDAEDCATTIPPSDPPRKLSIEESLEKSREEEQRKLKEVKEDAERYLQSKINDWQAEHPNEKVSPDWKFHLGELAFQLKALERGILVAPAYLRTKSKEKKEEESKHPFQPKFERQAFLATQKLRGFIEEKKGQFVKNEDGSLHIIIEGRRISLDSDPNNYGLARLLLEGCHFSTVSSVAKSTIQQIQVEADEKSDRMRLRRFATFSAETATLYIPISGGGLLRVTAEDISQVPNGQNEASFWVEHPEDAPFKYSPSTDTRSALADFEKLLVETQACKVPEMRWFVGMGEAFFPYIRDAFAARFIMEHIGPSQHGKTTGAQRFLLLHGLGEVKGDCSVAALANDGDKGLLVLDNREQANFDQELIDYALFLSTGAERSRSSQDGSRVRKSGFRPVAVITTIEGVPKRELQNRCVAVEYHLGGGSHLRGEIESEITRKRDAICSAMMLVLQRYLSVRAERRPTPNPIPNFSEHFTALCDLLRAYGEVAGKPERWSEELIKAWSSVVDRREQDEDALEYPITRVLREKSTDKLSPGDFTEYPIRFEGVPGKLYVTDCGALFAALRELNLHDLQLPKSASALGRRIHSATFCSFRVVDEDKAPDIPMLRRSARKRPIGFFVPDDEMTAPDADSI